MRFIIDDPLHHPVVSHPGNNKFPSQLPLSVGEAGVCCPQLWVSLMPPADILIEAEQLATFFHPQFSNGKKGGGKDKQRCELFSKKTVTG